MIISKWLAYNSACAIERKSKTLSTKSKKVKIVMIAELVKPYSIFVKEEL